MNEIELFYNELNQSNYDRESNSHILSELNKISTNFKALNDFKNLEISETERMAFAIQKSFSTIDDLKNGTVTGLNWSLSGIQTLNDKSTQPFYWPDVRNLTQANFDYFEDRYKTCKNLYAKTEFGLLVYFGSKTKFSKHIEFKKTLFKELFDLSQDYLKKSRKTAKINFYISHYFSTFKTAFLIAHKSKIKDETEQIVKSLIETHGKWNIKIKGTFRILYDLSKLSSEYYNVFKSTIDYEKIISKNIKAIKHIEKTNINSAIDLLNVNIEISKKTI